MNRDLLDKNFRDSDILTEEGRVKDSLMGLAVCRNKTGPVDGKDNILLQQVHIMDDLVNSIPDPEVAPKESFSTVFGNVLNKEGVENQKICAITAAMKYCTGLQFFAHTHPKRFFDVGMAEQHAVTFAAGLASQGMLPVVCIYSTLVIN